MGLRNYSPVPVQNGTAAPGITMLDTPPTALAQPMAIRQIMADLASARVSRSVLEYGSTTDDTLIQAAVNDIASTGGIITLPPVTGGWNLNNQIVLPQFVKLRGSDWLPDISNGASQYQPQFNVLFGAGTDTAAVQMNYSSGIEGIAFVWPNQVPKTATTPIVYGPAIATPTAIGVYDNINIRNISLYGAYKGIRLNYGGRWRVSAIQGDCFYRGFEADQCYDACYLENVHFWDFYTQGAALELWTAANGTAFNWGRVDQLFGSKLFSWNHNIAFNCGTGLWANLTDISCDTGNTAIVVNGVNTLTINGAHLIGSAKSLPAVWVQSGGTVRIDGMRVTSATATGMQIDGGASVTVTGSSFENAGHAAIITSPTTKVDFSGCNWALPPMGKSNVKINGQRLPYSDSAVSLGSPYTQTASTITGGFSFDLSGTATQYVQWDFTGISQRNSRWVLEFDYQLPVAAATWYFQILLQTDTGTFPQVLYAPTAPLNLNGASASTVHVSVPFFGNNGRFRQLLTMQTISTAGVASAALKVTNVTLFEESDVHITSARVAMMMTEGYNLDAYGMGQTLEVRGGKRVVTVFPEAGIGRSTVVPTSQTWQQGQICRHYNANTGDILESVCKVAGTPGTWANLQVMP